MVQWKLPDSTSVWVQQAGRAAWGFGRVGLAVLLVEKSAFGLDCETFEEDKHGKGRGRVKIMATKKTTGEYTKGAGKKYAENHGVNRGHTMQRMTLTHWQAGAQFSVQKPRMKTCSPLSKQEHVDVKSSPRSTETNLYVSFSTHTFE